MLKKCDLNFTNFFLISSVKRLKFHMLFARPFNQPKEKRGCNHLQLSSNQPRCPCQGSLVYHAEIALTFKTELISEKYNRLKLNKVVNQSY